MSRTKSMSQILIVVLISLSPLLCASQVSNAQESKSDEILKSIYANFKTSTFDEQYDALEQLLVAAKSENNNYNYNFALTNLSTYAKQKNDYIAFTEYTEQAYQHWQQEPNLSRERIYYTATQAIVLEFSKGNKKKALDIYFVMLSELKKDTSTSEYLTKIYTNLASDFQSIGDLESALTYNQKALNTINENDSKDRAINLLRGKMEGTQGHIYLNKKDYHKAIKKYTNSIDHLKNHKIDFGHLRKIELIIESSIGMAISYLKIYDLPKAKETLDRIEQLQKEAPYKLAYTLELRGQYYIQKGNKLKAQELLELALKEAKKSAKIDKKFPIEARIIMRMGDGEKEGDDLLSALENYQQALMVIDTSMNQNLLLNPKVANIIYTERTLEVLTKKAETAASVFQNTNDRKYFEIASNAYQSAVDLLDKMKVNFLNQDTKYFIASNASSLYNEYIKLLSDQFKMSKNADLISIIYSIAEKNKSTIAFDELQFKYALANAQIPEELKQKHRDLKIDIAYSERLLGEIKHSNDEDLESIQKLNKKIFNLNEEFIALDQKLNREYAEEINSRESLLTFPSMQEIRSHLNSEDIFIETFQSEDQLYFIAFDQNDHFLLELPLTEIDYKLEKYIEKVSSRPTINLENDLDFINTSNEVYNLALGPILEHFRSKNKLIIVPDGLLSSIPFESLITDKNDPLSFLIQSLNVAYLYASRQIMSEKPTFQEVNILSLAPQFEGSFRGVRSCDRDSLSNLPYAKSESEYLKELYSGTFLNTGEVNKGDLIKNINSHQIIHIGTHACVNQVDPMLNEIHFSDSYLTNKEIENQMASPELIVLGACNTANGKYIKGQGLLSLSKGFLQAGSKCIQASLWAIDDYASSEIIKEMFTDLKTGSSKSEALRKSKLSFLEKGDKLRVHPYFWAGIIQTGNDSPLFKDNKGPFLNQNFLFLLGLILLIGIALFFNRKVR